MKEFAFEKGFSCVMYKDVQAVRKEIMDALHITTYVQFRRRLKGEIIPRVTEKEDIEKIFRKYGVGVNDIWGINDERECRIDETGKGPLPRREQSNAG